MKKLTLAAICASLLIGTTLYAAKEVKTENDLGLRKENLYTEKGVTPVKADFSKPAPGMSKKFARSYENAPPLIPHSVDGFLPITRSNNACLGCHMPNVAKSMGATPLPPTHFKDFFAQTKESLKKYKASKVHKNKDDIAPQRFNCSQCHVPQANVDPLVENRFKPDFRDPNAKQKSNLIDTLNEGVK